MRLFYRRHRGVIPTGIDRVSLEYIRHYGDEARAVLSLGPFAGALRRPDSARMFEWMLMPGGDIRKAVARMALKNAAWEWLRPGTGNSILFNTANLWINTGFYAMQLRWLGARPVFFVHDLIPIHYPEYFRPGEGEEFASHLRNVLRLGEGIIVNSRYTERALTEYTRSERLPCPPIAVAPLASALREVEVTSSPPLAEPYFVVLGTIEPRKNHLLLLHLWRELAQQHGTAAPRLYVVGQRGWECENVVDLLERCEPLRDIVIERGRCDDAELARLLRHARALLMPTFAEGFGLPVAEALSLGTPVISNDLPSFREMAGDIPEYADAIDGRRWKELVLDYAKPDSALRAAQLERMKAYRPMTWARHFEIVDRFLESLP